MQISAAAIGTLMGASRSFSSNVGTTEGTWVHIVPDDEFIHMAMETGIEDSTSFCSPLPKDSD